MEKEGKPVYLSPDGRWIEVQAGPYEIKTVAVQFHFDTLAAVAHE